jgi:general secretion pathway protein E
MNNNVTDPFSIDNVCHALLKSGLLNQSQVKELLGKKNRLKQHLETLQADKGNGVPEESHAQTMTAIDVLVPSSSGDGRSNKFALTGLNEDILFRALAKEWDIPYKKIDPLLLDLNMVTSTIPRTFAKKHLVLPISRENGNLSVATPNPLNMEAMDDIARAANVRVTAYVSPKTDIKKLIDEFYGFKRSIAAAEDQASAPLVDLGNLEQYVRLKSVDELPSNDQHIVTAVNHILLYAFDQRASDIHIEPKREVTLVRMRIDGVLHTVYELPKKVHYALVSRIKNLSRMDMAEKRRPQDGRIKTDKGGMEFEIRVSTIPVAFGEKVVMRIMDPKVLFQDIGNLGFGLKDLKRFKEFIGLPHGIVLVCGPTGSGKSTTLYSTMRHLSTPEINITTVEDPIEMVHPEFNQIAVQSTVGITFGSILRNILRQDPDIIMIGEMRDLETAENAIQAAMTGHLVLSTIHTNDAPSTISRLIDLGVPSFLIQSTLVGILAQRLVRKICSYCVESFEMSASELKSLDINISMNDSVLLKRGKGCQRCRGTGYFGRSAIVEVLPYSSGIRKLTTPEADLDDIRKQAVSEGMTTMRDNAIQKMLKGETTYQEVMRVTWSHD